MLKHPVSVEKDKLTDVCLEIEMGLAVKPWVKNTCFLAANPLDFEPDLV
jgi:hypothetical protein